MNAIPIMHELRAKRRSRGITQAEIARRAGYAEDTIRRWERGKQKIYLQALNDLANAIGLVVTIRFERKAS